MKTKHRSAVSLLLLGTFLLAWAGTAAARDIVVEYVFVTVASLNTPTPLSGEDTITVKNGGTLWVDANAIIKDLIIGDIGDATLTGKVLFSGTASILTVANDVKFGAALGNTLDMAYITPDTGHTLKVGRNFLQSGNGSFISGSARIEYNGIGNQTVTARIGGTGATIFYKDVALSGSPATGNAIKTFAPGVSIQGLLDIREKARAQGDSASYGSLGRLQYSGSAVTSSTAEWPSTMPVQVIIATQVTLDSDKTLGPGGAFPSALVVQAGGVLKDNGKTLTVLGNIDNNGSIEGAGSLVLGGTSSQTLSGNGAYGNLTLNNSLGGALPLAGFTPTEPVIRGRLVIQNGKLLLPTGTTHQASLLTYGGADKAATVLKTYGATTSFADFKSDTVFNSIGTGTLGVPVKPVAVLEAPPGGATLTYGTSDVTISGTVKPPAGTPDFAAFGNGAVNGEVVTVTIATTPPVTNTATVLNGAFSATFTASGLSVGSQLRVDFYYPGGINLAGNNTVGMPNGVTTLSVVPKPLTLIPVNTTKVYNGAGADPVFSFSLAPPDALVGADYFTGALARLSGVIVGTYDILPGTLVVTNNNNAFANLNYTVTFDNSKKLTITQKPVTVNINSTNKIYGAANPAFTVTFSPALITGDTAGGTLQTTAGQNSDVGSYSITRGTFTAGPNYSETFVNGNLVIDKKAISVAFIDKSKTYGNKDADPLFSNSELVITPGLVTGDTFGTTKPGRDAGETVAGGPYLFRQGGLSLGAKAGNYNVTYVPSGGLTIGRRVITASASNPNRKYGESVLGQVNYAGFQTAANNPPGVTTQTAPAILPVITWGAKGAVTQCSLPNAIGDAYGYTIAALANANDPNHSFTPNTAIAGTYNVGRADLTIRSENKTKVADGNLFDYSAFTVSYSGLQTACGDTAANSLAGFLVYGGTAVSAVAPGVYPIAPSGLTSPSKYNVINANGYLSITTNPQTENGTTATWAANGSRAWMINHPNGTAGGNPGWGLLKLTGALDMTGLTAAKSFRLDLVTMSGNQAGRMPKFDPTRPYSWKFVEAGSIQVSGSFNPAVFDINYDGANLFSNPVFEGTFAVRQNGNLLFLDFTPVGTARDPGTGIVSAGAVRGSYSVTTLLADVRASDVDVLYLQPNKTTVGANETVTIDLNVANLKQPIVGVNAYINFSSAQYIANASGDGAPQVQAGGGVWDTLIYNTWNVGGDLDVVIAVNLTAQAGTSADGTVGKITLTPTKKQTSTQGGSTRVVFRVDDTATVAGGSTVLTYLEPAATGAAILPARVMTPAISITGDPTGPSLSAATMTAIQNQPHGASVDVKAGTQALNREVVRTGGSGAMASGPVIFKIPASDAGVGLSGPPTLTLKQAGQTDIVVPCTTPNLASGDFLYEWNVPATIANGTWSANVAATDKISPSPNTTTVNGAFNLSVNTREVTGVVELQSFKGANRTVTFKVGDNDGANANSVKSWPLNLNFTSGLLLNAGAFQNRAGMATRIQQAGEPLSTYLAYGDVLDLSALSGKLVNQQGGVSMWIHDLLYGYINNLSSLAGKLTAPTRAVDSYIMGRLSNDTILKLAVYQSATSANKPALAPALTTALLNDLNTIVMGPSIYEPVRFASLTLSGTTWALIWTPDPTRAQLDALNRGLLQDACAEYVAGQLDPGTAQRLTQYAGGADPTLLSGLVKAFDTMTISPSMWPPASAPFGQCLYNEGVFLGVQLSAPTIALLTATSFPTGNDLTLLNQYLLQDAYAGLFVRAPLSPATVAAARNFNPASPAAFDDGMITDLNALIGGGSSIYTVARFAPWAGAIDPSSELGLLLAKSNPTAAERIRLNRLLLELGYDSELSKGVLAPYRLVQVLATTSEVTAKTAWNLRARQVITVSPTVGATADFVSDGVSGWTAGKDYFLRGGDLTGDNAVNLSDYNALRLLYGQTGSAGAPVDINGDGSVNLLDYSLLQSNWAKGGDGDAK